MLNTGAGLGLRSQDRILGAPSCGEENVGKVFLQRFAVWLPRSESHSVFCVAGCWDLY